MSAAIKLSIATYQSEIVDVFFGVCIETDTWSTGKTEVFARYETIRNTCTSISCSLDQDESPFQGIRTKLPTTATYREVVFHVRQRDDGSHETKADQNIP